ncbi:carbohydrate ABC transporter permease [Bacillus pseudomycoides]|uniref:carbohydrate ABC transporter permease n=1 Tax=Bacillus pseudomycoides TaxID=64104 RepID=UPI003F73CD5B
MKINKSRSYIGNVFLDRDHRSLNKLQDKKKSPTKFRDFMQKDTSIAFFFLLPSAIGFSIFYLIPFVMGMIYSLMDGTADGSFVGLANYKELLGSASFLKAATNTFWFTAVSVPLIIIISLLLALCLNQNVYIQNWLRSAFVLPLVVPVASIVMLWQILFDWNGTFNLWLHNMGFERIDWMKSNWAIIVLSIVYLWKNIGYNIILFLAALQNIPKEYYETAKIEGAGRMHTFLNITLIYLTPTMFFVILMSIINSFKVFREAYLIAGSIPHDSMYMMQHYMNNMFVSLDIQKLTAAATLMVAVISILVFVLFAIERRFRKFMN